MSTVALLRRDLTRRLSDLDDERERVMAALAALDSSPGVTRRARRVDSSPDLDSSVVAAISKANAPVSRAELAAVLKVDAKRLSRPLARLKGAGAIRQEGQRRGSRYRAA